MKYLYAFLAITLITPFSYSMDLAKGVDAAKKMVKRKEALQLAAGALSDDKITIDDVMKCLDVPAIAKATKIKGIKHKEAIKVLLESILANKQLSPSDLPRVLHAPDIAKAINVDPEFVQEVLESLAEPRKSKSDLQNFIHSLSPNSIEQLKGAIKAGGPLFCFLLLSTAVANGWIVTGAGLTAATGYGFYKLYNMLHVPLPLKKVLLKRLPQLAEKALSAFTGGEAAPAAGADAQDDEEKE